MTFQVLRGWRWSAGAVAVVAVLVAAGLLAPAAAVTGPAAEQHGPDRTSATEARRVDSVPTPTLVWRDCAVEADGAQCATTASPVLVVGNTWDPSTSYEGAVRAASLLPNSRLLTSVSWGHTAYLQRASLCVTSAVDTYLLTQVVPAPGTTCHGDLQPFQDNPTVPPN
jgi:pimeloyl-ACP methyl ester carboxylesterase